MKPTTVLAIDKQFLDRKTTVVQGDPEEHAYQPKRGKQKVKGSSFKGIFKTDAKSISLQTILEQERVKIGKDSFLE